jgi:predicted phage-related endonuclease
MTFPDVTVINAEQRSPEWFAARCGRLTASAASAMLATIKSGEAAARRDLRIKLVVERLTGQPQEDGYVNADMQRGIDLEADAFAAYEAHTGSVVERVGFLRHDELMIGCSPDGVLDGGTGILELKVPKSATHFRYLKEGKLPAEYVGQVMHTLWVTGAAYLDFCSFDPRFPEHLQLFVCRVPRVDIDVIAYAKCAEKFLVEVENELAEMTALEVA